MADRPRSGGPRVFPATVVAEVKALACEPPAQAGAALARWSCPELAREAADRGICDRVSASTVRRWLSTDAIKPWQHRSWIFPRDRTSRSRPPECSTCTIECGTGNP
ncbi:helix-turn-helix domain-containing protein [Lentzea sp. NPDC102401]|uniref:helix-turn-helix domain-containing protein n=1 Tax=Lentzea sp. NPDC102401 TaxID=3364128 RepID=UPI00381DE93D